MPELAPLPQPKPTATETLTLRPASARDKLRLFRQVLMGVVLTAVIITRDATSPDSLLFYLGLVISILALLPVVFWARTMEHNYPFFEIFMATNLAAYGVPLMSEKNLATLFDEATRTKAGFAVILFEVVTLIVFYSVQARPKRTKLWTESVFVDESQRWMIGGLVISTIYVVAAQYDYLPDTEVAGILRAIFFGIGTSCTFIVSMAWGLGKIKAPEKIAVIVCILIQFLVLSTSLVLRTGVSLALLAIVGYFFGARRLPYLSIAITVGVCAILNIGKYDLRAKYWEATNHATPAVADMPGFYGEWFAAGLHPHAEADAEAGQLLLERNSLLQMLCLVINQSPDPKPFLEGDTYEDIPGQFVPRIFWPGKPLGHVSTSRLSIYYGLQDEQATGATTIAFGLLPEAYANFGLLGIVMLGALFGWIFKLLVRWSLHSPIFSYPGLMIILLTAWVFQTELTMSIWLTSLYQGAVSIVGFVFIFRRFQEVTS